MQRLETVDEEDFRKFMIDSGLSKNSAEACVSYAKKFEWYLLKHKEGKRLREANPRDAKDFALWGVRGFKRTWTINAYMYGIQKYYEYKNSRDMVNAIKKLRRHKRPKPTARPDLINWDDFQINLR